jgi:hypothetical protein
VGMDLADLSLPYDLMETFLRFSPFLVPSLGPYTTTSMTVTPCGVQQSSNRDGNSGMSIRYLSGMSIEYLSGMSIVGAAEQVTPSIYIVTLS